MIGFAGRTIARLGGSRRHAPVLLGRYLTTPKPHVVFSPRRAGRAAFVRRLRGSVAVLDPAMQLLYRGRAFFAGGEPLAAAPSQRAALARLADRRRLAGAELLRARLSDMAWDWYRSGQLHLQRAK